MPDRHPRKSSEHPSVEPLPADLLQIQRIYSNVPVNASGADLCRVPSSLGSRFAAATGFPQPGLSEHTSPMPNLPAALLALLRLPIDRGGR